MIRGEGESSENYMLCNYSFYDYAYVILITLENQIVIEKQIVRKEDHIDVKKPFR